MRLINTETGPRLELSLRKNGVPILGTLGEGGDAHRKAVLWLENSIFFTTETARFNRIEGMLKIAKSNVEKLKNENKIPEHVVLCRSLDLTILENESLCFQAIYQREHPQVEVTHWKTLWDNGQSMRVDMFTTLKTLIDYAKEKILGPQYQKEMRAVIRYMAYALQLRTNYITIRYHCTHEWFRANDYPGYFSTENDTIRRNGEIFEMVAQCTESNLDIRLPNDQVETKEFQNYFCSSLKSVSDDLLKMRPLRDVIIAADDEVLLDSDPAHTLFIQDQYRALLARDKYPSDRAFLASFVTIEEEISKREIADKQNEDCLLRQYDRARLMYWLMLTQKGVAERLTRKTEANINMIHLCKTQSLAHLQRALELLEQYIKDKDEKFHVIELWILYKGYVAYLENTQSYCSGLPLDIPPFQRLAFVRQRAEHLYFMTLTLVESVNLYSLYLHDSSHNPPVRIVDAKPFLTEQMQELNIKFRPLIKKLVNGAALCGTNQNILLNSRILVQYMQFEHRKNEVNEVFQRLEKEASAVLINSKSTQLEKAEALYFIALARHRYFSVFYSKNKNARYEQELTKVAIVVDKAHSYLSGVNLEKFTQDEHTLLRLYLLELTMVKFLVLTLGTASIAKVQLDALWTEYFSLSSFDAAHLIKTNAVQLEHLQDAHINATHLLLVVHWDYIKEVMVEAYQTRILAVDPLKQSPVKQQECLTDNSSQAAIKERIQNSTLIYCGCEECDVLFGFQFKSAPVRAFALSEASQFWRRGRLAKVLEDLPAPITDPASSSSKF